MDSRYKLKTGEEVAYFPPIQNTDSPYATEAAMHLDQANQLEGYGYLVDGIGAFTYLGTVAGTASDYEASNVAHPLVETAVPVGAVFTDTDTIYNDTSIQGEVDLNTAKVSNIAHPLVETTVPINALFTDTIYDDTEILSQIEISRSNISYGESYIANYRNSVLDDGATFFPSDAGYQVGKLKENGLMNNCSLLLLPSAVKAGTLYSVKPQDRSGDFTVDRNCPAKYTDEDGILRTALANVPRIDYSTGEAALLVELQRTNLIKESNTISFNTLRSVREGSIIIGALNGFKYSDNGNNPAILINKSNINQHAYYTSSISVIPDTSEYIDIRLAVNGGAALGTSYKFDFNTEILTLVSNNSTYVENPSAVWSKKNGVYRFSVSGYCKPTSGIFIVYYFSDLSTISIMAAQLEAGSTASSYIPTNGSTVTRLTDDISVPTPAGVTAITETIDGVEQTPITTIPTTYSLPVGNINKVIMK